ncbi:MAG: hypothetical protein RIT35_1655, partial [Pseudomonadota bacterium]|jgi:hypothetical protein
LFIASFCDRKIFHFLPFIYKYILIIIITKELISLNMIAPIELQAVALI